MHRLVLTDNGYFGYITNTYQTGDGDTERPENR